jgi:hypothetical protein
MKSNKHLKIDLLNLYAKTSVNEWNVFLTTCLQKKDLHTLQQVFYGTQLGMNDLAKAKLNTQKINVWFVRLQRSIEITIKKIIKSKDPSPLDNPLNAKDFAHKIGDKRKRDHEIELYLKRIRY